MHPRGVHLVLLISIVLRALNGNDGLLAGFRHRRDRIWPVAALAIAGDGDGSRPGCPRVRHAAPMGIYLGSRVVGAVATGIMRLCCSSSS